MRVLITDALSSASTDLLAAAGIDADTRLKLDEDTLAEIVGGYDGWLIRSGTQVTARLLEAAGQLKVVGRAGVGVDNVDLEAATRRGVLVVNAPDGNTISTAEHTCAMALALMRQIPQANASLRAGSWERKAFSGSELSGKVLGVVGVGKIGRAVAKRLQSFGMTVLGFDPVLTKEAGEKMGLTLVGLDRIWAEADLITVHTPLNDATRGLLNAETLAACKPGVRLVNCARGGIIDEAALLAALESGHVGGAALDVFSEEPPETDLLRRLIAHPNVVATPHIAASTEEAQEKVGRQVTEQVVRALRGEPVTTPVNAAAIRMAAQPEVQPYLDLARRLGAIAAQLAGGSLRRVTVGCYGEAASRYAEVLTVGALTGILGRWADVPVNLINAGALARELGLHVEEQRHSDADGYANLVEVCLETTTGERSVKGTVLGSQGEARLVGLDHFRFEVKPDGHLLFYQNVDRPGMLATVGQLLADAGTNIASLTLGRTAPGEVALTVIVADAAVPAATLRAVRAVHGVDEVYAVSV